MKFITIINNIKGIIAINLLNRPLHVTFFINRKEQKITTGSSKMIRIFLIISEDNANIIVLMIIDNGVIIFLLLFSIFSPQLQPAL
ncbi:MAG: hypothetical protein DRP84_00255 [Spirochaetes bacterium]|nr:MAG: hypothetical protein DRP84_00255 [Spirochaetota bacterium]